MESAGEWISTADAARRLGLTPGRVRRLIASGALRARRVGGRFLVRASDVEARATAEVVTGRPFSPRRAWALVLLASGIAPTGLDAVTTSKLRRVLRERDLWSIRHRLASRAERRELRAHASDVVRLDAEPGVVRTGVRYAADAGLGLIAPNAPLELIVDQPTAARLTARYRLRPSDRPSVVLHVVPAEVRAWLRGPVAPPLAVALDLAHEPDARTRDVARAALGRTTG